MIACAMCSRTWICHDSCSARNADSNTPVTRQGGATPDRRGQRAKRVGRADDLGEGVAPPWQTGFRKLTSASRPAIDDRVEWPPIGLRGARANGDMGATAGVSGLEATLAPHATPGSDPNWL